MIQRIVLLQIKNDQMDNVIKESKKIIPNLPKVKSLQVGRLDNDSNFNLALIILFDNLQDIAEFSPNPIHRDYVDNFLKPKIERIKAYNVNIL